MNNILVQYRKRLRLWSQNRRRSRWINAWVDTQRCKVLEIGPLDRPLVPRTGRNVVRYADVRSEEELRMAISNNPHRDPDAIVPLDYIIGERPLSEVINERFDCVVTSHVMEHVPDFLGYLKDIAGLLNPGGLLYADLPDRRYTFDIERPFTSIGELIENHFFRLTKPAPRTAFDQSYYYRRVLAGQLWQDYDATLARSQRNFHLSRSVFQFDRAQEGYVDNHCNLFDPDNFREAINVTRELGFHDFRIVRFRETQRLQLDFTALLRLGEGANTPSPFLKKRPGDPHLSEDKS